MKASNTIKIEKRDLQFDLSKVDMMAWHPGGRHICHYFNVRSVLFPQGERFFIRSVRNFRHQIHDPQLKAQVNGFIGQEAMHSREHESYNRQLEMAGYDVAGAERFLSRTFRMAERFLPDKMLLAMTIGLEHLTAIAAEATLADEQFISAADPIMERLWRWHALEETEHKAVAFDVYTVVAGRGFTAWLRRCVAFVIVSFSMQVTTWVGMLRILWRTGGLLDWQGWHQLLKALWATPGTLRQQIKPYFAYFKPSFHPWDSDSYDLVQHWRTELSNSTPS